MGRCAWFDCCKRDVELGLSSSGEPEGNDNEGFSQEWFDEDYGLGSSRREAEELRLQQLQIEQEIQELEQAQDQLPCFYFREIPNKPPPPYTPPGQTTRSLVAPAPGMSQVMLSKQDLTEEPLFIPSTAEELTSLTLEVINYLYNLLTFSGDLEHAEAPPEFYDDKTSVHISDIKSSSRRVFKKLVFDLTKDILKEAYCWERKKPCAPWDWSALSHKINKPPPKSKEILQEAVVKQVLVLFGFAPNAYKEKFVIRWSRKKRDYVDEILMKESHEEESAWTNYDEDEVIVKNEIAIGVLDSLLEETVEILLDIRKKKLKKSFKLTLLT